MSDTLLTQETTAKAPMAGRMLLTVVLAAMASLMFGLDVGVISGALGFITDEFHASEMAQSWIVSSMMLGAAVGALGAGYASATLGRSKSLTWSAVLFVLGAMLCALAHSVTTLIIGRTVIGLAIGVASFVAPLYISEITDEHHRGSLTSMYQLMITLGILLAFISNALLSYYHAWRWMFGIVAIPGTLFLAGSFFLPESPRWLVLRGRDREAVDVLANLRGSSERAHAEVGEIRERAQEKQHGLRMLLNNGNFRRSFLLGITLQAVQQFTGINVVMYYGPRIFASAGFGQDGQMWGTAIVGLVNFLATFIAIGYVDRWGRRPLLITGFAIMTVGLGALAILLNVGTAGSDMEHYLTVATLLCFITGFAFSAGPLVWILCSEIQPLQGRDFATTCSTLTNWVTNFVVGVTFLPMLTMLGSSRTFWVYAGLNCAFIIFTLFFVPETKGVTLEAIERKLNQGRRLREIGR